MVRSTAGLQLIQKTMAQGSSSCWPEARRKLFQPLSTHEIIGKTDFQTTDKDYGLSWMSVRPFGYIALQNGFPAGILGITPYSGRK